MSAQIGVRFVADDETGRVSTAVWILDSWIIESWQCSNRISLLQKACKISKLLIAPSQR